MPLITALLTTGAATAPRPRARRPGPIRQTLAVALPILSAMALGIALAWLRTQ
jgi:hypothetical protein